VVIGRLSAAVDVCCVSFPAGGSRRVEYNFAPEPRSGDGTTRGWMQRHPRKWIYCPGDGSWSWNEGPWSCSEGDPARLLSAATWRDKSSIRCRSTALSGSWATLASAVLGPAWMMRYAQAAAASMSPPGSLPRMTRTLGASRPDQKLQRN
jgi:hypothetical protein